MIAYFVVFALCGIIVVQTVIYYRERLKLYNIIEAEKLKYSNRDKPRNDNKKKRRGTGYKRALNKWRNGGESD